ncbi:agmatinase [bacterium]|nr:agmatinase [bacterium]
MEKVPNNFLGIEKKYCEYATSNFAVLPVPYEATTSYGKGTRKGPSAIIAASQLVEFYDEELDQDSIYNFGVATLKPISFKSLKGSKALHLIEKSVGKILDDKKIPVCFGGEHTVTGPITRAFHARLGDSFSVLQLDAHSDLRETYSGTPFSHACVMKRIWDFNRNIVQIGIRAQCMEERQLILKHNIDTFYAKDIYNQTHWMEKAIGKLQDKVYITIDCDGFDPSIIPATGTPEPGGLGWFDTLEFLRKVSEQKTVIGFDIVELAPTKTSPISDYNLAKLAYRLMGYIIKKKQSE